METTGRFLGSPMAPEDRNAVFGIDCSGPYGDGIIFKGGSWSPGGEYVQRLRIKNVSGQLRKLKYKVPETRYFSMAYPEVMVLSPGTECVVDVVFRPVVSEVYSDTIYFKMMEGEGSGGFHIPVRALLPKLHLSIPPGLDMGYCQVSAASELTFQISNIGQVAAPFEWLQPPPFQLTPMKGSVPVGGKVTVTCRLEPEDASVLVANACLMVGEGVNAIKPEPLLEMKLSAVGKYCHVAPSESRVNFGHVLPGSAHDKVHRSVILRNLSVVPAAFKFSRLEKDCDEVFELQPMSGVILPEQELKLLVKYTPITYGMHHTDHYRCTTVGGNSFTLTLAGTCAAPEVRISKVEDKFAEGFGVPDSINFRDVVVGASTTRVATLYNSSELPCWYSVLAEGTEGLFEFSSTSGVIPGCGTDHPGATHITLKFAPRHPSNFYRRVYVLLEGQMPLLLDLMGTGYISAHGEIKEVRPAPIRQAHVQAFRNRVEAGLGSLSPDELEAMADDGVHPPEYFAQVGRRGTQPIAQSSVPRPITRSGETTRNQVSVAQELFREASNDCEITASSMFVNFGCVPRGAKETQEVTLFNHTNGKVHAVWRCAGNYSVEPPSADIPPRSSTVFELSLAPESEGDYFVRTLEALVYFKNQRTFRLVKDTTLSPPWVIPVTATGHSFASPLMEQEASCSFSPKRLTLPPCHCDDSTYTTLRLTNTGNTPAFFRMHFAEEDIEFDVLPRTGLIPISAFQIFQVRFTGTSTPGIKRRRLLCTLNNQEGAAKELIVMAICALPKLEIVESEIDIAGKKSATSSCAPSEVFIKPTQVGMVTHRPLILRSSSRIPLVYEIELPSDTSGKGPHTITPRTGTLLGNAAAELDFAFRPPGAGPYNSQIKIKARALAGPPPRLRDGRQVGRAALADVIQTLPVVIHAEGVKGAVRFEPEVLSLKDALVNTDTERRIRLLNTASCDVSFRLSCSCRDGPQEGLVDHFPLRMVPSSGIIPAHGSVPVDLTFSAASHGAYDLVVACAAGPANTEIADDGDSQSPPNVPQAHAMCRISARASFPRFVLEDICLDTPELACSFTTTELWKAMNIADINRYMADPLAPEGEQGPNGAVTVDEPTVEVAFPPSPVRNPGDTRRPQLLTIMVKNVGFLPSCMSLHLPNEEEVELEPWASTGEPTEDEVRINEIIDRLRVFSIGPQVLRLAPGESAPITISYSPTSLAYDGIHELPVLIKIEHGRSLRILLRGTTLPACTSYLHVPIPLALAPVAMGSPLDGPPVQTVDLVNVGEGDMAYEIDESAIATFNQRFGLGANLLTLIEGGGKGVVPGLGRISLRWQFVPLDAEERVIKLPVHWWDARRKGQRTSTVVSLTCCGYDSRNSDPKSDEYEDRPSASGSMPPRAQLVAGPGQPARLSTRIVNFGKVPQAGTCHRSVMLINTMKVPLGYNWSDPALGPCPLLDDCVLEVSPMRGTVQPGGRVMITLSVNGTCPLRTLCSSLRVMVWSEKAPKPAGGGKWGSQRQKTQLELMAEKHSRKSTNSHVSVASRQTASSIARVSQTLREGSNSLSSSRWDDGSQTKTKSLMASGSSATLTATSAYDLSFPEEARECVLLLEVKGAIVQGNGYEEEGMQFALPEPRPFISSSGVPSRAPAPAKDHLVRLAKDSTVAACIRSLCEDVLGDALSLRGAVRKIPIADDLPPLLFSDVLNPAFDFWQRDLGGEADSPQDSSTAQTHAAATKIQARHRGAMGRAAAAREAEMQTPDGRTRYDAAARIQALARQRAASQRVRAEREVILNERTIAAARDPMAHGVLASMLKQMMTDLVSTTGGAVEASSQRQQSLALFPNKPMLPAMREDSEHPPALMSR